MTKVGPFTPVQAPAPVGSKANGNGVKVFVCQWKKTEGLGGKSSEIIATTQTPAVKNIPATVTVFQMRNGAEANVGVPINAMVVAGTLQAKWQVPFNQNAGDYHFKVSAAVSGTTYIGKTTAALKIRTDGFEG